MDAVPVAGFDDFEIIDPIECLEYEALGYRPMPLPVNSNYDPIVTNKIQRPGCEYESAIRNRAGEPDLEELQMAARDRLVDALAAAHDNMEEPEQKTKDNVSGANIAMPGAFLKPIDASVELILLKHPSLRIYCPTPECTEVDPAFGVYPNPHPRIELKDELQLRNATSDEDVAHIKSISKTASGCFINNVAVPTYDLPGNFGVRQLQTMPTDERSAYRDQHNNIRLGAVCDERPVAVPDILP